MKIAIDARAAVWYRGTGMGTYTTQLIKHLCKLNGGQDYRFLLPEGKTIACKELVAETFCDLGQTKDFFWEEVYRDVYKRQIL